MYGSLQNYIPLWGCILLASSLTLFNTCAFITLSYFVLLGVNKLSVCICVCKPACCQLIWRNAQPKVTSSNSFFVSNYQTQNISDIVIVLDIKQGKAATPLHLRSWGLAVLHDFKVKNESVRKCDIDTSSVD